MSIVSYDIKHKQVPADVLPYQSLVTYYGQSLMVIKKIISSEMNPVMFETDLGLLVPKDEVSIADGYVLTGSSGVHISTFLREIPVFLADNQGKNGLPNDGSVEVEFNDVYFMANFDDNFETLAEKYDAANTATRLAYLERTNG